MAKNERKIDEALKEVLKGGGWVWYPDIVRQVLNKVPNATTRDIRIGLGSRLYICNESYGHKKYKLR